MKLIKIALKELKLIKTQKISLLLIFFFPIITILAIGSAFGNVNVFTGTGFTQVPVGIYVPSDYEESEELIQELELYSDSINLIRYQTEEEVIESINKRKAKIGLIVEKPQEFESTVNIRVVFDNSALLETQVTLFITETILNEVSYEKSNELLKGILENLDTIKQTVKTEITTIDGFIAKLDASDSSLRSLENQLNQIDLSTMKYQLETFDTYYYQSLNDVSETRNEIYKAQGQLSSYRSKIQNTKNKLTGYRDDLVFLRNQITNIRVVSPEPAASQLLNIENQLNNTINEINSTIYDLDHALVDIDNANATLNQTLNKLNDVETRLHSANTSIQSFKYTVTSMQDTLNQIKLMLSEAKSSRESIRADLVETKNQMQELSRKLETLSSLSTESIIKPLRIEKEPRYESTEVAVITPMAISIVLLLTSLLLTSISTILEKNQGAALRAKLSPTMHLTWISGKILGQLVFAIIEAALVLIVALIGFGVMPAGETLADLLNAYAGLFAVLLIIGFSFISIGLFLTNFTKTQSTAILSSLLISIPLIFLSGMILPTSFMPSFIRAFSEILPLTVATELITSILVRGSSLQFLLPQILLLVVPALIMIAVTLIYPKIKED